MAIYFAFCDENGAYKRLRGSGFLRAHPVYLRATVHFPADQWKNLEGRFRELKNNYGLPLTEEIKWSYAWSLKSHARTGKSIKPRDKYYFLRDYDPERLQEFLLEAVSLLRTVDGAKAIITITDNAVCQKIGIERLLRMHLQESMQRIEMDMQADPSNLCVLFVDPVSADKDKALREAYAQLYHVGDLITRYSHIKDSLNLEHSHHSVGIQMADYMAGAVGSALNGRPLGQQIYAEQIRHILRRHLNGSVGGYGIREVPGNKELRKELLAKLGE
jgi:hypothetical protein